MVFQRFGGPRRDFPPRQMVKGNWKCSDCGKEITELPFEPAPDRPIYCRDCWTKRRTERFGRQDDWAPHQFYWWGVFVIIKKEDENFSYWFWWKGGFSGLEAQPEPALF